MRWVTRIVVALAVVAAALILIGIAFLPRQIKVSRSIVIDAPAAKVWPLVSDLRVLNDWSPWADYDPDGTEFTYSGPQIGVGQTMHWESDHPNVGNGTQEIVAIETGRSVTSHLEFGDTGEADATMDLEPAGERTKVTWGFETDVGMNPVARWFALMFDKWVGNDYERGLLNLKQLAEARARSGG